ncbi:hypothetical protein ACPCG0_05380 [Propionibacteriaceae bacterium Y1923]
MKNIAKHQPPKGSQHHDVNKFDAQQKKTKLVFNCPSIKGTQTTPKRHGTGKTHPNPTTTKMATSGCKKTMH